MADNRSKTGREGSPLWANLGAGTGLSFQSGQIPTLLVPLNTSVQQDPPVEAGEVDHFLGQDSPTNFQQSDISSNTLFGAPPNDSFQIGYGSAPTPAVPPSQNLPHQSTPMGVAAQTQPQYVASSSTDQTQSPLNMTGFTSVGMNVETHYQPPVSVGPEVSMYNPSVPVSQNTEGTQSLIPNPSLQYSPVVNHWFYCKITQEQPTWYPFSYRDSMLLEEAFLNGEPQVVQTEGGRYDVHIDDRVRHAVYWNEDNCEVRRCSWFYRDDSTMKFIPYSEDLSEELEETYMQTLYSNTWHKKNELTNSVDVFIFHSPHVFVQFSKGSFPDEFGASYSEMSRPKVVKRGIEEIGGISDGESTQIDHLVFVVHGIGPVCDLRFRGIVECVDDMRSTSSAILKSHFQGASSSGKVGRVEFLPIYWHDTLRCDAVGVDKRLDNISLPSIKKLRQLHNEVFVDVLFYNSPLYSQKIVDRVGGEMNRLYKLFLSRNPGWSGQVSIAAHSLGSQIVFDVLSMQGVTQQTTPAPEDLQQTTPAAVKTSNTVTTEILERSRSATPSTSTPNRTTPIDSNIEPIVTMESVLELLALSNMASKFDEEQIDLDSLLMCSEDDLKSIGIPLGPRKKILKYIDDRKRKSEEQVQDSLPASNTQETTNLPDMDTLNLSSTVNRQHSWLLESASNTQVAYVGGMQGVGLPLVQYPQLDFKVANFFALGSPIAMFLTIRGIENLSRDFQLPTCTAMFNIFHPFDPVAYRIEPLVNPDIKKRPVLMPHHKGRKRLHLELKENLVKVGSDLKDKLMRSLKSTWATINDFAKAHTSNVAQNSEQELSEQVDNMLQAAVQDDKQDMSADLESVSSIADGEVEVGQLNQGRRIDYVLQETPLESFNEYLFALSSHLVYWNSEDVSLMLLKEMYAPSGVTADVKEQTNPQPSTPLGFMLTQHQPPQVATTSHAMTPSYQNLSNQNAGITPSNFTQAGPPSSFVGPPPTSGFVPTRPPPMSGFIPKH